MLQGDEETVQDLRTRLRAVWVRSYEVLKLKQQNVINRNNKEEKQLGQNDLKN